MPARKPWSYPSRFTQRCDYYERATIGSFIRLTRIFAYITAILLPGAYVALVNFHQELLPTALLLRVADFRESIPFPVVAEILIMEFLFEVLREAGVRLPRAIGSALSIVGALILGDAAIGAGLVSPSVVIIVALTAISSFTAPTFSAGIAGRLLRFVFIILAVVFNKLGIQRFAMEHGWSEANSRVKCPVGVNNVGDWLEVVSIFRSPAVLYVEASYQADLSFESSWIAERYYEDIVDEKWLPFLVSIRSSTKESLEEDVLRFVLSIGSGQRWEGVVRADKIVEETVFGFTIYQRTFWVGFDTHEIPINWCDQDSMTLHVIRQDRLNRADLTWNFKP